MAHVATGRVQIGVRVGTVALVLGLVAWPGAAQGGQAAPVADDVYKLELRSFPEIKNGRAAIVEGVVGPEGQKLAVSDLGVMQPVEVMLFAPDANDDVRIELSKFILDVPARTGSTRGEGFVSFAFRTEGDLQIKLASPDGPNVYRLFVWVGSEVAPPMPAVFMSMKDYEQRQAAAGNAAAAPAAATGGSLALWIIAGALVVISALLGMLVLKRGRS